MIGYKISLISNLLNPIGQPQETDEKPIYHFNDDLSNIVTPVNADLLVQLLRESNYDPQEIDFLHKGFTEGFSIGYEGPMLRQSQSSNIPFSIGNKTILWNKLMKEVELGRVAGPFNSIPFKSYIQSPIGLVPKSGSDQCRLIFHLSYDFQKENKNNGEFKSVNYHTPKEKCSVKYRNLDYAVRTYLQLAQEILYDCDKQEGGQTFSARTSLQDKWCKGFANHKRTSDKNQDRTIFAGKSDLKSAFHILGLS